MTVSPAPHPITGDEFVGWMQSFDFAPDEQTVAVAVSGGPDSMALAVLARDWAAAQGKNIIALIVDHALRPESGHEAAQTKARLNAINIPADILLWQHEPITSKFHIQARLARYDLMLAACRTKGIKTIMLAHHRDDQAETIMMRIAKGSGIEGLAGMSIITMLDDVRLMRPVMHTTKERLVATCDAAKIPYVTDPSNVSDKYARGRLRRVLPLLEQEGFSAERLCDLGERASVVRDALDHYTQEFMARAARQDDFGVITLNWEAAQNVPRAILERGFVQCLQTIHAETYAPEYKSLTAFLDALGNPDFAPRTIHGCLVSRRSYDVVIIREIAAITDRPKPTGQTEIIWDKRWKLSFAGQMSEKLTVRPLGTPPHDVIDRLAPKLRQKVPQGRARAVLPAIWQGEEISLIPSFDYENGSGSPVKAQLIRRIA